MFERLAPDYDRLNTILTFGLVRGWRRALVRELGVARGERVLDVCTGTGQSLAELRRAAGRNVVGIDFTPAMLRRATGLRVLGDALALPFPAGTFDAAASAFALRDVADQAGMIEEMCRVTRPGGRVGLLEIGPPRARATRMGFDAWFRGAVPRIAGAFGQGESHRFLVRSVAFLPSAGRLVEMLEGAGLAEVRWRDLTLGAARLFVGRLPAAGPPPAGYG